jgi:hypothetical protein
LLSGNAGRALVDYGQAAGSQEYQNAFNRYNTNRASILNPLQSLAGQGQSSSNTMGAAAGANATAGSNTLQNYGTNAGGLMVNAGNAQASGYLGQANSWNQALNNAAGGYQNYTLMNNLFGSNGGAGGYQPFNNYASNGVPMPYSRPA